MWTGRSWNLNLWLKPAALLEHWAVFAPVSEQGHPGRRCFLPWGLGFTLDYQIQRRPPWCSVATNEQLCVPPPPHPLSRASVDSVVDLKAEGGIKHLHKTCEYSPTNPPLQESALIWAERTLQWSILMSSPLWPITLPPWRSSHDGRAPASLRLPSAELSGLRGLSVNDFTSHSLWKCLHGTEMIWEKSAHQKVLESQGFIKLKHVLFVRIRADVLELSDFIF